MGDPVRDGPVASAVDGDQHPGAAGPLRGDLVLTLRDAQGDAIILVDLLRPRAGGFAPWSLTQAIPESAPRGAATLTLFMADSAGGSAQVTRRLWIE